jgi:hypothetical protein
MENQINNNIPATSLLTIPQIHKIGGDAAVRESLIVEVFRRLKERNATIIELRREIAELKAQLIH